MGNSQTLKSSEVDLLKIHNLSSIVNSEELGSYSVYKPSSGVDSALLVKGEPA